MKRIIFMLGLMTVLFTTPIFAATENDLREIAGLDRISVADAQTRAQAIIASCSQDTQWNELIDMLDEYGLNNKTEITEELANNGAKAYKAMMSAFNSGESISAILDYFEDYDTYYLTYEEIYTPEAVALEKISEKSIKSRLAYAQSLIDISKDLSNIGRIGYDAETFLKKQLSLENVTEGSISVYTTPNDRIYSQLRGTITKIINDSVTIASGATIKLTYSGIKPSKNLKEGDKITQGQFIALAKDITVTLSMRMDSQDVNPLIIYGTRAIYWYESYLNANPGNEDILDLDDIKDYVSTPTYTPNSNDNTVTDENGNKSYVKIVTPDNEDKDKTVEDKVLSEDPFDPGNGMEDEDEN